MSTEEHNLEDELFDAGKRPLDEIIAKISEQAATGTHVTPRPDGWVRGLPELGDVACEWMMMGSIKSSYLWFEDGNYYAAQLPSGLEEKEGRPLNRYDAAALLENGVSHKPVDLSEVPADV